MQLKVDKRILYLQKLFVPMYLFYSFLKYSFNFYDQGNIRSEDNH